MESQYLISTDEGQTTKGPFSIDQIKSLYLANRLPEEFLIRAVPQSKFRKFSEMATEIVSARAKSASELSESIEESLKEAVSDEKKGIWVGFLWFLLGLGLSIGVLATAEKTMTPRNIIIAGGLTFFGLVKFLASLKSTIERRRESKQQTS